MPRVLRFPEGFLWGASTSAHQVEGGQENDWTAWERLGKIRDGSVSGKACDHWHRYETDFDIAQSLGHAAHRFSLEWSRIEPREGEWSLAALDHYRDVIRGLRRRGMEPFVTLWHFTNPRWFVERGGWEARDAPERFGRYVNVVAERLPEVKFWLTVNEPNVYALMSYLIGEWPPEAKNGLRALRAYKTLARAHRAAYQTLKRIRRDCQVGCSQNLVFFEPRNAHSIIDRWASRLADEWYNHRWLRWIVGSYDFIGVNHYLRQILRFRSLLHPVAPEPQGTPQTDFGWQMYPEAMYRVLKAAALYEKPIYITENGVADAADRFRKEFIRDELVQVHRAIQEGVDVRGYFYWSLLDNFEWREGFAKRFGLVDVDFSTQRRTMRPSAQWFADVCRRNVVHVDDA